MTQEETKEMLKGLLEGVNVNQMNIVTGEYATVYYQEATAQKPPVDPDEQRQVTLSRLTPIFYGSEEEASAFLQSIEGMKPTQITEKVNLLVSQRKISELSRKRDLWSVLNEGGFYLKSETNWNMQVK
ncbi:MAG: hypothetical protein IJJ98_11390 [Prevotella sp.]|jgi:hypothetical protein|nr:hypothetical protein [Prevotella sp.]MBQ7460686.1 hypothetical protein [Bacteroidaceae bacterium]MBR0527279.1 hypothetical protein [Prevotella sp.]